MGASISKSTATNATKSAIDIANSFSQNCAQSLNQTQDFSLSGCSKVKIQSLNLGQNGSIDVKCLQNDSTRTQMRSAISSSLTQKTSAITQSLGLPSAAVADSVANEISNLSQTITNTYTQTCTAQFNSAQKFSCKNSKDITIGAINLNQSGETLASCTQSNRAVVDAENQLAAALSQTTSAKEADSFATLLIVFFVFLGVIGFGFVQFSKSETAKWIIILIFVVVIVLLVAYAYNAFEKRLWPFQKSQ